MKPNKYNYHNQTGMFRNKILIQKLNIETDSRKQQISTFVDFGYYFAMKKTQKAEEVQTADNEKTNIVDRFIIKYSQRLNDLIDAEGTTIRIIHNDFVYDVISAVNDNGLNEHITVVASREVTSNE